MVFKCSCKTFGQRNKDFCKYEKPQKLILNLLDTSLILYCSTDIFFFHNIWTCLLFSFYNFLSMPDILFFNLSQILKLLSYFVRKIYPSTKFFPREISVFWGASDSHTVLQIIIVYIIRSLLRISTVLFQHWILNNGNVCSTFTWYLKWTHTGLVSGQ